MVLSRRSQGTKVQGETLYQICDREAVEEISLIKMNIEGAERYALLGMQSVIRRTGTICVACHDFLADLGHGEEFRTRAFVEGFLIDQGFKLASRRDDPRDWVRDHIFGLRVEGSGE